VPGGILKHWEIGEESVSDIVHTMFDSFATAWGNLNEKGRQLDVARLDSYLGRWSSLCQKRTFILKSQMIGRCPVNIPLRCGRNNGRVFSLNYR